MLKKLSLILPIILVACQPDDNTVSLKPEVSGITVLDGRLVFPDELVYIDKITELERLTPAEQSSWPSQFKFKPLVNVLDGVKMRETFMQENRMGHLGPGHLLVLNEDRLIQFGEDVVFFDDQAKYYMNVKEFNELADKRDIVKSERQAKLAIKPLGSAEEDSPDNGRVLTMRFDAWNKGDIGVGGWQSEDFYFNNYRKKFVNEWWARTEQVGTSTYCNDVQIRSTLYLRAKLEEKHVQGCCNGAWYESVDPKQVWFRLTWMDVYFDYGAHPSWAGCSYRDLSFGPYTGTYNIEPPQPSLYGNVLYYITSTGVFWGEWHATFDLKRWRGRMNGEIHNIYSQTGLEKTYNMYIYNY